MSTNRVEGTKIIAEMFLQDVYNAGGSFELCFHKAKTYATAPLSLLPGRLLETILAFLPSTIGCWVPVPPLMWRVKGPLWQETSHFVRLALFEFSPTAGWPQNISSHAVEFHNPSQLLLLRQPSRSLRLRSWVMPTYTSFEYQGRLWLDCPTDVYGHVCCDLSALLRHWMHTWSTDGDLRELSRQHGYCQLLELDEVEDELRGLNQLSSGDIGPVRLLIAQWEAMLDS